MSTVSPETPARPPWITLGLVAVTLCAVIGFLAHDHGAARKELIARRFAALAADPDPRPRECWQPTEPGNAATSYRQAIALGRGLDGVPATPLDADIVARLATDWGPALTALRAGARCSDVNWGPFDPDAEAASFAFDSTSLAEVAIALAGWQLDHDEADAGIDVLLDAARFAADLAAWPTVLNALIACTHLGSAVGKLTEERLARLSAAQLHRLAAACAVLDAAYPCLIPALAAAARYYVDRAPPRTNRLRSLFTFDDRDDSILALLDLHDALARHADLDWPSLQQFARRTLTSAEQRHLLEAEDKLRTAHAHLRLLRLALACHEGAAIPRLDDPLGAGPLREETTPTGRRFASQREGIDRMVAR